MSASWSYAPLGLLPVVPLALRVFCATFLPFVRLSCVVSVCRLLAQSNEGRRRKLRLRTYAVICLNEECGLLEWVANTSTFRHEVTSVYLANGLDAPMSLCGKYREQLETMQKKYATDGKVCPEVVLRLCNTLLLARVGSSCARECIGRLSSRTSLLCSTSGSSLPSEIQLRGSKPGMQNCPYIALPFCSNALFSVSPFRALWRFGAWSATSSGLGIGMGTTSCWISPMANVSTWISIGTRLALSQ